MKSIESIEGIGKSYAETLKRAGIQNVETLLEMACRKEARRKLAAETGLSEKLLLKWANMADLFRINGVASQYAELLERAGVDTVKELAQRNPESLHSKMIATNEQAQVVRRPPSLTIVNAWISQAKALPPKISH